MDVQFVETGVFPQGLAPADESRALRLVELCGRTAYKSEDRITEGSARAFVLMLKGHGHLSVLEHSNAVLKIRSNGPDPAANASELAGRLIAALGERNGYHRIHALPSSAGPGFAVSGNFRSWIESLRFLNPRDPEMAALLGYHLKRFLPSLFEDGPPSPAHLRCDISLMEESEQLALLKGDASSDLPVFVFKIVCDRGITHELVRHRVFSFTQESTRYVNYQNKGMTLILPEELQPWFDSETGQWTEFHPDVQRWLQRSNALFDWYREDLGRGLRPEIARDILPNLLKSEIFISGRWSGWRHFITLRTSKQAHPRIRFIAQRIEDHFRDIELDAREQQG